MTKKYIITTGISGFLVILMGAMGSHVLSGKLDQEHIEAFRIAYQFQMFHTIALLGLAFLHRLISKYLSSLIYYSFVLGIIFFSFSIYLTSTMKITNLNVDFMHAFPPIGGVLFMIGWLAIMWGGIVYVPKKGKSSH